ECSISQSSITGNTVQYGGGGILSVDNTLAVTNSTIAHNTAQNGAGAYVVRPSSGASIPQFDFDTITENQGSGLYVQESQGASVELRNTVLAGNSGSDCELDYQGSIVSLGFNYLGSTCTLGSNDIDALLFPLRLGSITSDEHGATYVMLPHPDSVLIDAGSCSAANLFADQRGHARPASVPRVLPKFDGCDIGAAELDDDIFWDDLDH
ncbi:MAG: hypothetical protein L0H70_01360, partial [Xanthomonadales bacterium]|nr:hypothetical protein [Xanthomonadales bacterium]